MTYLNEYWIFVELLWPKNFRKGIELADSNLILYTCWSLEERASRITIFFFPQLFEGNQQTKKEKSNIMFVITVYYTYNSYIICLCTQSLRHQHQMLDYIGIWRVFQCPTSKRKKRTYQLHVFRDMKIICTLLYRIL